MMKIDGRHQDEPTIHDVLTESVARDAVRFRILKDVNDPGVLERLSKVFPELLNQSDQVFNDHILNPSTLSSFSIESLVPAVKSERIPVIREYFYKNKELYEYIVLLLQRMKYLQVEKHQLKSNSDPRGPERL